jgi:PAS domain S-box-containing protein
MALRYAQSCSRRAGGCTGIRRILGLESRSRSGRAGIDVGNAGVRKILDTAQEGVWLFDTAGHTTFANRRMAEMLGATPEELIGSQFFDFLDDADRAEARRNLAGWLAADARRGQHLMRRDGRDLWARISASPIEDEFHSIVGMLGMFTDITERHQMEHALRRAETEFRIVFDSSAVGIVVVNQQGYAVMANNALLKMVGYPREQIASVSFEHVTHIEDVEEDRRLYAALMSGEIERFSREKRYVHRDGTIVWVHVNVSLVRGPEGEPQYAISMIEDVSERHRAGQALRASENQLRHALDAARMVIWDWDILNDRLVWSPNVDRMFDVPPARVPRTFAEVMAVIAPRDRDRVSREIEQAVQTPDIKFVTVYEVAFDGVGARWIEARGEVERDASGRAIRMLGTLVDVTTRERAKLALRESQERFRTLSDAAFEGIAISENGRLVDINDRLLDMVGQTREEVIGREISTWYTQETAPTVERRLREADTGLYEAVIARADGARIDVEIQARYFEAGGRTLRVAAVRDVTARRRAGEQIKASQERELRSREEFAHHLLQAQEQERQRLASELHDGLGQSLSLIRNRMHLALEESGTSPSVIEHLRAVAQLSADAVAEVRHLAQNLRPLQIEQLGLTEALRSLVEQVRDSTTATIDCVIENVDDVLREDAATHMYRIVQEALNNVVRHAGAEHVVVTLERDVGRLRLDVRDDGAGFVAAQVSGGLGLTSMRERAQMLGGTLHMQSAPRAGTHVHVDLPFIEPTEQDLTS